MFHAFGFLRNGKFNFETSIAVNIALIIKCYISKSKLILCEYNTFYFSEIGFTSHEIKQGIVFWGTPGIYSAMSSCPRFKHNRTSSISESDH